MSMSCESLHNALADLPIIKYPFENTALPDNGIYFFYEHGESCGHAGHNPRIVRVGTHRDGNFKQRIKSHFHIRSNIANLSIMKAKPSDMSIFRKNIGRALLSKDNDPYIDVWNIDFISLNNRKKFADRRDIKKEIEVEEKITEILQNNFYFRFIEIENQNERMGTGGLESRLIGTIASCPYCRPSENWLGKYSPVKKIADSGLWLTQHISSCPLDDSSGKILLKSLDNTLSKYHKRG